MLHYTPETGFPFALLPDAPWVRKHSSAILCGGCWQRVVIRYTVIISTSGCLYFYNLYKHNCTWCQLIITKLRSMSLNDDSPTYCTYICHRLLQMIEPTSMLFVSVRDHLTYPPFSQSALSFVDAFLCLSAAVISVSITGTSASSYVIEQTIAHQHRQQHPLFSSKVSLKVQFSFLSSSAFM